MRCILLTGMSGVGKSTLIGELAARGYMAIDMDDQHWSEWRPAADGGEMELVWREDRVCALLAGQRPAVVFLSGCASNQVQFYPQFEHIVLLSAPDAVMLERLAARTNNPFGKRADELARIMEHKRTIEPLLRRSADVELDASAPVGELVARLEQLARADEPGCPGKMTLDG